MAFNPANNKDNYLSRTSNLPTITSFTIMCWFRLDIDTNAYNIMYQLGVDGASDVDYEVITDSDGTTHRLWNGSTLSGTGTSLNPQQWYHSAITVAGTGSGDFLGYIDGALDITHDGNASVTSSRLVIGADPHIALGFDGRLAHLKIWSDVLTADEIKREMYSIRPQRIANLNSWYPIFPGASERIRDYSANGYDLTNNGTIVDEAGPPVPWGFTPSVWSVSTHLAGRRTLDVRPDSTTSKDTSLSADNPTTNYDNYDMQTGREGTTNLGRAIIYFDLSSIPPNSTCHKATLFLRKQFADQHSRPHSIYEILPSRETWVADEATWNEFKTGTSWASPGGGSTALDTKAVKIGTFTSPSASYNPIMIDLDTDMVEKWFGDNNDNYGVMIRDDSETTTYAKSSWASSDSSWGIAHPNHRPKLHIEYSAPDVDSDHFSEGNYTDIEVPGTSGYVRIVSIRFNDGEDMGQVGAGDQFRLKITRVAESDDASGDAELHGIELREV